ncbi:hypothetical protein H2248_005937 [Termitomyces sp. 'cryptogamus']|nr:hypothetical protein H2248_005937 [Termitomyces sp. 'cryptogamus']
MPYVDLYCVDDYASIFYTTNTPHGNVGGFNPDKPSIIILHPLLLDSSWLSLQFGDPRLTSIFNMVAFDMRTCGKSSSRPTGRHDSWVDAADLAICHQMLHLPPCHILALDGISINCALRFAVLFPELCLSLTLCNVPAPKELDWMHTAYDELLYSWRHAEDLEAFEHVAKEAVGFIVGKNCDPDLQDDLIAFWETSIPPVRMLRVAETQAVLINRIPLRKDILSIIKQPVLIVHGEFNETCPRKYADKLASQLVNAEGGAFTYTIKGGMNSLSIIPQNASLLHKVLAKFILQLPRVGLNQTPPVSDWKGRMKTALSTLAELMGDPSIATRDSSSSLSFCCLPQAIIHKQSEDLRQYRKGIFAAFSPLGPDGRPTRRYSDRRTEHWFTSEENGLSIAGNSFLLVEHPKQREKKPHSLQDRPADSKLRRANQNPNVVEKQVILRGSMARAVTTAAQSAAQLQQYVA